jgi:hypothetical protein
MLLSVIAIFLTAGLSAVFQFLTIKQPATLAPSNPMVCCRPAHLSARSSHHFRIFGAKLHQGTVWRGINWTSPRTRMKPRHLRSYISETPQSHNEWRSIFCIKSRSCCPTTLNLTALAALRGLENRSYQRHDASCRIDSTGSRSKSCASIIIDA